MEHTWTTKDGRVLKFSEMSTRHLTNAVAFYERTLRNWYDAVMSPHIRSYCDPPDMDDLIEETMEREYARLQSMRVELARRAARE